MDIPQTDRRLAPLERFFKAWLAIFVGLLVATPIGALAFFAWIELHAGPFRGDLGSLVSGAPMLLFLSLLYALFFGLLALPFVPVRNWIVGPRFPFLRPGYVAVALYGLGFVMLLRPAHLSGVDIAELFVYELIALIATLAYVPVARRLGLFKSASDL